VVEHVTTFTLCKLSNSDSHTRLFLLQQRYIMCYLLSAFTQMLHLSAFLNRGDQFARISATSGWGADALAPDNNTRPSWTEQVNHIASITGYKFKYALDSRWDQGKLGQYFASYAEKKLIAYFLDRDAFMPQDREPDQKLEGLILEVEDSLAEGKHLFRARGC
jgi:hypothetical protein